jgi:leucyl/phenylalanyl-tRNA---protein transferase
MPVFRLRTDNVFPPPELATAEGVLAVGGDLSPERLLLAYRMGIFPWYGEDDPILWWSPDPRFVLLPAELNVSRSMRQLLKKDRFRVTFDRCFREVVEGCREPRKDRSGTWIHVEMAEAYCALHRLGYAHSVEVWEGGEIVGGLYGVSLGRCFFGESMFTKVNNASKVALIVLARRLHALKFVLIDCQVYTDHLRTLGARMVPRSLFLRMLAEGLNQETLQGNWNRWPAFREAMASL